MAFNFPASPTNGQTYGSYTYDGNVGIWRANTAGQGIVSTSANAPTTASNGDMWFNPSTGSMYVYYVDQTSAQWVESRAPISADGYVSPNYLINGGFDIWQRGTTSTATGYSTCDRWWFSNVGSTTYSQETSNVSNGSKYSLKILTSASVLWQARQAIETLNATQLAGKYVTLSAYLKSSTAINITLSVFYAVETDVSTSGSNGTWLAVAPSSGGTGDTNSSTFTRISGVYNIPSGAKSVMIVVKPTSSVASGISTYISNVQLEEGTIATPFRRNANSIQGELAACQRYFQIWGNSGWTYEGIGIGQVVASTVTRVRINFITPMRIPPISPGYTAVGDFNLEMAGAAFTGAVTVIDNWASSTVHCSFNATHPTNANWTNGKMCFFDTNNTTSARFYVSAEL